MTAPSPPSPPSTSDSIPTTPGIHVSLTSDPLNPLTTLSHVRSPHAGATVLFSGTTRSTFAARPVLDLHYTAYAPLALRTLHAIAAAIKVKHALVAIAVVHRLGAVPIGEESILIAVSSPHRAAAWRAAEECLEEVKARAEIWKLERFVDDADGVWRANRDGVMGVREGPEKGETGEEEIGLPSGPVVRPRRPGESGHGAVVNPKPS